jgi:hypothetical protein
LASWPAGHPVAWHGGAGGTDAAVRRVVAPGDRLAGAAFSPVETVLAAIGDDADLRLWGLAEILRVKTRP